ncbi:MAG: hypothetical protein NTX53_19285, partial [candidate division WOR-3 bacterium]|nr:hypothetical protein [candidate division WOR-3 bacterium]
MSAIAEGVLVGKAAADQLADSAHMTDEERRDVLSRTFQGIKRRLGENLPMALPDGAVVTPVELTAEILKHIKRSAEQRCFNGRVFS